MKKFPVDAPKRKVIKALENLGFRIVREREHISMVRENPDGSKTPPPAALSSGMLLQAPFEVLLCLCHFQTQNTSSPEIPSSMLLPAEDEPRIQKLSR